uniref:Uncharacterized protein n=1 Tax=Tanacetum cinerariifolium TaxID=118510 RepID=A0A699IZ41_TANCI|nr:hypothetical protein [Tanacetum cinerariifolium]
MPLFPPPEHKVIYFDDLDLLKDFKNEFPAIIYNDALMSKSGSSTVPVEIPHCIDEFDLKTETSCRKLDKDNDDDEIDIKQSSRGNMINTDEGLNMAYPGEWMWHIDFL